MACGSPGRQWIIFWPRGCGDPLRIEHVNRRFAVFLRPDPHCLGFDLHLPILGKHLGTDSHIAECEIVRLFHAHVDHIQRHFARIVQERFKPAGHIGRPSALRKIGEQIDFLPLLRFFSHQRQRSLDHLRKRRRGGGRLQLANPLFGGPKIDGEIARRLLRFEHGHFAFGRQLAEQPMGCALGHFQPRLIFFAIGHARRRVEH